MGHQGIAVPARDEHEIQDLLSDALVVATQCADAAVTLTVADALAAWATREDRSRIPAEVRSAALRCITDTTGCALAAASFAPMPAMLALTRAEAGAGRCRLLVASERVGPLAAAELNAAAAHALDFDDTCYAGIAHGSAVIWPAVLAVAQAERVPGARALDAFITGAEAAYALGKAFGNALYLERGWWTTAYLGAVGAAVACADLLDLSPTQAHNAIGLAASGSMVVRALFGSHAKPYYCGAASREGVRAAMAARAGMCGPARVFEHPLGTIAAQNDGAFDQRRLAWLGRDWSLATPGIAFKRYPVCSAAQAAAQATIELLEAMHASAHDVEAITCAVPPLVTLSLIYPNPSSPAEAQFSLPFAVSCAALHLGIEPAHLTQATLSDAALRAMMARVRHETLADLQFAQHEPEGAQVTLRLFDRRECTLRIGAARGMPTASMSNDELRAKFVRNAGAGSAAEVLARRLLELDREPDCDFIAHGTIA